MAITHLIIGLPVLLDRRLGLDVTHYAENCVGLKSIWSHACSSRTRDLLIQQA